MQISCANVQVPAPIKNDFRQGHRVTEHCAMGQLLSHFHRF